MELIAFCIFWYLFIQMYRSGKVNSSNLLQNMYNFVTKIVSFTSSYSSVVSFEGTCTHENIASADVNCNSYEVGQVKLQGIISKLVCRHSAGGVWKQDRLFCADSMSQSVLQVISFTTLHVVTIGDWDLFSGNEIFSSEKIQVSWKCTFFVACNLRTSYRTSHNIFGKRTTLLLGNYLYTWTVLPLYTLSLVRNFSDYLVFWNCWTI